MSMPGAAIVAYTCSLTTVRSGPTLTGVHGTAAGTGDPSSPVSCLFDLMTDVTGRRFRSS
ncbi:hypothetical protein GCM10027575_00880 [Phytohabitans suffuscus]